MNIVVGSGPAAAACADALLEKGLPVTMLDVGLDLSPRECARRDRLAAGTPEEWSPEDLAAVQESVQAGPAGVPLKPVFGSDFYFRETPGAPAFQQSGTRALRSFAFGGLSRAWGATVAPFYPGDLADWPFGAEELDPHLGPASKLLPLSGVSDGLDPLFGPPPPHARYLTPSPQAKVLLENAAARRPALNARGIFAGQSRLAVRPSSDNGCRLCGLCLHGCPTGMIYEASQTVMRLKENPRFIYRPNFLVRRLKETPEGVVVHGSDENGNDVSLSGGKVFLGAGVFGTAAILAATLGIERSADIASSQSFLTPALLARPVPEALQGGNPRTDVHTLSQLYIVLSDPTVSPRLVQFQVYTLSALMRKAVRNSFLGPILSRWAALERRLLERLVVVQGLLHSADSDPLTLRFHPDGKIVLSGRTSGSTRKTAFAALKRLSGAANLLGLRPLRALTRFSSPGQSFHTGGTFPHAKNPTPGQSDLRGVPAGLSRVHVVDASVFPTVPAPPLTLSVMANARRIAHAA